MTRPDCRPPGPAKFLRWQRPQQAVKTEFERCRPAASTALPRRRIWSGPECGTQCRAEEALLKERQRAFIELVTTTETLRMKVAHLEEIIEERDRELTKLRVARAAS